MNNSIVQHDGRSYIHIGNWYIGIHVNGNNDLLLFIDNEDGKVVEYDMDIAEDDDQWGKAFHVDTLTHYPPATQLRGKLRVKIHKGQRP